MRLPSFERTRTMALLHRFMRTAMSAGRMPSLVGREIFRSRVRAQPSGAFEDAVLFVCDVENCIALLEPLEQRMIAFCVLENRSEWEASRHFHASQGFVSRHLGHALDMLHTTFCQRGLLPPMLQRVEGEPARGVGEKRNRRSS